MDAKARHALEERIVAFVSTHLGSDASTAHADVRQVADVLWVVYATALSEVEIDNGGFERYFESWIGGFAPEAIQGYRQLGAMGCQSAVEEALRVFKVKNPRQRLFPFTERWEWPRPFSSDPDLNALDDRFFKAVRLERPASRRHDFIEAKRAEFQRLISGL